MMKKRITKEFVLYMFFGCFTTLINVLTYSLLYYGCIASNTFSNIAAWFLSVAFAYITNRLWVFESHNEGIIHEAVSFFGCRGLTGFLDLAAMYIFVDIFLLEGAVVKVIVNIAVITLNYIFSKLYIFKKS